MLYFPQCRFDNSYKAAHLVTYLPLCRQGKGYLGQMHGLCDSATIVGQ